MKRLKAKKVRIKVPRIKKTKCPNVILKELKTRRSLLDRYKIHPKNVKLLKKCKEDPYNGMPNPPGDHVHPDFFHD